MSHSTHEHLEHAEHSQHHGTHGTGFDKRVAMTMSMVAALLAAVTLLSHRAHNETIQLHTDAARFTSEANVLHTKAADQWALYQAKRQRNYQFQCFQDLLVLLSKDASNDPKKVDEKRKEWTAQHQRYDAELPEIEAGARELEAEGKKKEADAEAAIERSHGSHARGNRFDVAELAVELALVLCSVSILSKQRSLWLVGILLALAGVVIAGSVLLPPGVLQHAGTAAAAHH